MKSKKSKIISIILFTAIFLSFYLPMTNSMNGWDTLTDYKAIFTAAALLFYLGTWFCAPRGRLLSQIIALAAIVACIFRHLERYTGYVIPRITLLPGFYIVLCLCGLTALTGILAVLLDKQQRALVKEWCVKHFTRKNVLPVAGIALIILIPLIVRWLLDFTYVGDGYSLTVVSSSFEIPVEKPDELLAMLEESIKDENELLDERHVLTDWRQAAKNGLVVKAEYHGEGKEILYREGDPARSVTEIIFLINKKVVYTIVCYEGETEYLLTRIPAYRLQFPF